MMLPFLLLGAVTVGETAASHPAQEAVEQPSFREEKDPISHVWQEGDADKTLAGIPHVLPYYGGVPCEPCEPCPPYESLPPMECAPSPCYEESFSGPCGDPWGAAPSFLAPYCENRWGFSAALLIWQVRTEGLDYALPGISAVAPSPAAIFEKVESVVPSFEPGVRLGCDYLIPCWNQCLLELEWTYFQSKTSDSTERPPGVSTYLFPTRLAPSFRPNALTADATFRFRMNMVDFDLARSFCFGDALSLTPFGGIRGAWMRYDLDVRYVVTFFGGGEGIIDSEDEIHSWGVGPRFGFATDWKIWRGMSFVSQFACDLLWTRENFNHREFLLNITKRAALDSTQHLLSPVLECFLGFSWDYCFCNGIGLNGYLGWEAQYFLDLAQYEVFGPDVPLNAVPQINSSNTEHAISNIGLSGFTLGVNVSF